uniref:Uncharacterized protein n=1 Tax=Myoviridae sp. ct8iP21 TaxID=2825041 RepID=A0A8S5V477_9CAUD|nr:MAG TPA: hypothetical protein [Myoviridae sp. ct8iP21]
MNLLNYFSSLTLVLSTNALLTEQLRLLLN